MTNDPRSGALPRILTIMGSGETAPTMVKVHRMVLERLGPPPVSAVLLDTPFGFQENARELAQKAIAYFAESLRTKIEVASTAQLGSSGGPLDEPASSLAEGELVSKLRAARYVFAGPGSPSYALRKWRGTAVPSLLVELLENGGAVTFSSAAALTLGVSTVPVYEVYKAGEDPSWLEGLDLLATSGLSAAVIPHYNNAEGGTHDTRFCYLGERRLSRMEKELPEGAFVLGVDEHTALVMDLGERTASVEGLGVVTIRAAGRSRSFEAGSTLGFDEIAETARLLRANPPDAGRDDQHLEAAQSPGRVVETAPVGDRGSPLLALVRERESQFSAALSKRDAASAAAAALSLEETITEWSRDVPSGDEMDRAHASLRSLVFELGKIADKGIRDPRELLSPFVEMALSLRQQARDESRFQESDAIRQRLGDLGIEVRDTVEGSDWDLTET